MVREYYYIIVSKIDEELGVVSGEIEYNQEYEQYPSSDKIANAIKTLSGSEARVEKRYKLK